MRRETFATCRSCGARIVWARTAADRAMPIDRDPVPDGNLVIIDRTRDGSPRVATAAPEETRPKYRSHFSTCPNADQHRKPRPSASRG